MSKSGEVASPGASVAKAPSELQRQGKAALEAGAAEEAVRLLGKAVELEPNAALLRLELANALLFAGRPDEALAQYDVVIARQPGRAEAQVARADLLLDLGRPEEAAQVYRRALSQRPGFRHATHMLAMLGGEAADAGNEHYVAAVFDGYAAQFDEHLVGELGYRVPGAMRDALAKHVGGGKPLTTLDLGCGTGLVAEALQGMVGPIDGIDLSARMVEVARSKALYRTLAVGDIAELPGGPDFAGPYGLVTAGDVLSYVRDLRAVFAAVRRVLGPRGLFAFTVEDAGEAPVVLRSTGRLAHGTAYVRDLATAYGLAVVEELALTLRMERLRPVAGRLFILAAAG